MHPLKYNGSPGPYEAQLERLATMGEKRSAHDLAGPMPGWQDILPNIATADLDAHMPVLKGMADRDGATLHPDDQLDQPMTHHATIGAHSVKDGLDARQQSLDILTERAAWLSTYLTPEKMDRAIAWRDQVAKVAELSSQISDNRNHINQDTRAMERVVANAFTDPDAAKQAWGELVSAPETGGLAAAARKVSMDPSIIGTLKGGNTWLGLGGPNAERREAINSLATLPQSAAKIANHGQQITKIRRQYDAMEKPGRGDAEVADTLMAMRDINSINLHYMMDMADKVTRAQALIAGQETDPVTTVVAARELYHDLIAQDDMGSRSAARSLRQGLAPAFTAIMDDPSLSASLRAQGIEPTNPLADKKRPGTARSPERTGPSNLA
ncbi:MAG: hypothetical protein KI792_14000 [Alphaproteobacteria bacterium]|nr:hypothetical protein [Alphaproteobacteria bacterium SS10]